MNRLRAVSVFLISLFLFLSANSSLARSVIPLQAVEFRGIDAEILGEDDLVRVSMELYANVAVNANLAVDYSDAIKLTPVEKMEQTIQLSSGESLTRTFDFVIQNQVPSESILPH